MIIYDLLCAHGHQFEGWFPNASSFEEQQKEGMVHCSQCGVVEVKRLPAGGHIARVTGSLATSTPRTVAPVPTQEQLTNVDPIILIKAVNQYVQSNFKDVGTAFAEQAIQMQQGEIAQEPIHGTANQEQREKLDDAGVPYSVIPKPTNEFEN